VSLTVLIGGTRSGKSARAEALAAATGLPVTYVATGAAIDDEMRTRISTHRARRPASWTTVEPDGDAGPAAAAVAVASSGGCALVDGLGGWIATAQYRDPADARAHVLAGVRTLTDAAANAGEIIVVAEQASEGVTPVDVLSRAWVDLLGEATQLLVAAATTAELIVAGCPVPIGVVPIGVRPCIPANHNPECWNARSDPLRMDPLRMDYLRMHGDTVVRPGDADHAVNVLSGGPPAWLREAMQAALDEDAGRYPDERAARAAIAALHGRSPDEALPANGAAEALWLLGPALRPRLAAIVHPGFTETEAGLRAHSVPVARVLRDPARAFALDPDAVPEAADLVVVGHPASPSGTLDPQTAILALRRAGRTIVVDEAFMDLVPGEPGSLASLPLPDVIVVRSLTKSLAIPGIRAGYALAAAPLVERLRAVRPPWSVNALALAALRAAAGRPSARHPAAPRAAAERADLVARLASLQGVRTWPSHTNFVLVEVTDGPAAVAALRERDIAVRHAATFPGLGDDHLRLTARDPDANARLVDALGGALAEIPPSDCAQAPASGPFRASGGRVPAGAPTTRTSQ